MTITSPAELEVTYIERVNQAVADDNYALVDELATEYDAELDRLQLSRPTAA